MKIKNKIKDGVRSVRVRWTDRNLTRMNKRFAVDKSSYDGHFKSRIGNGYCLASGGNLSHMIYVFQVNS